MTGDEFENVFDDLLNGDEELKAFCQVLQEQVPQAFIQLHGDNGVVLPEVAAQPCSAEGVAELLAKTRAAGGRPVAAQGQAGEWCYGLRVDKISAVLLFSLPGRSDNLLVEPHGRQLLQGVIDYALLQQEQQLLKIENEQIFRQIAVLKQKHTALIEDNFRQYRLIQDKEKEYARTLESEIARQTAELRNTNARLEEASRLQSEFLANMSHELRTPMNAIIGFSDLLLELKLDKESREYAQTIKNAGMNLLVLINDILDLAKIEAGRIELEHAPFDLRETVDNVASLFRIPAREKKLSFMVEIAPQLPALLYGDNNRLRQILINLVGNAMKFTAAGEVAIVIGLQSLASEQAQVVFSVRDSGIGIPPERQQAIFDKFTQADGSTTRKYGGTGLGLAICHQLVQLMGGSIAVKSVEGEGSSFFFTLPLKVARPDAVVAPRPEPEGRAEGNMQAEAASVRSALRVLLVEDNPVNQRLASIIIKKQGCELAVAGDGIEALAQLEKHVFDLVLMDVQMPNMDGLEATRRIRKIEASSGARAQYAGLRNRTKPLSIIGLTAHARKEDEQSCYGAGMNGFLTKPIIRARLEAVLAEEAEACNLGRPQGPAA